MRRRNMGYAAYVEMFAPERPRGARRPRALGLTADAPGEIWLYDVIDAWADDWWGGVSAAMVVEAFQALDGAPVILHVNSPGGDVAEALAMYSTIKAYPGTVEVRVEGIAASAASYVALAGDTTVIEPNALMMIHDAWGIEIGNAEEMHRYADLLDKMSANIADIYATRVGGTAGEWRALMKAETWYTGREAVVAGLASGLIPERDTKEQVTVEDGWDLSVYAHTPPVLAGAGRHTPAPARHPITPTRSAGAVTSVNDDDVEVGEFAAFLTNLKGLRV